MIDPMIAKKQMEMEKLVLDYKETINNSLEIKRKINDLDDEIKSNLIITPANIAIDVDYNDSPIAQLKFSIPVLPPALKTAERIIGGRAGVNNYYMLIGEWEDYIATVRSVIASNYSNFNTFQNAIVNVKFFDNSNRLRDPDNLMLILIHNALHRCGIIAADDANHCRYMVSMVLGAQKLMTEIIVTENNSDLLPCTACTDCILGYFVS